MKAYELFTELSSENRLAILQILDERPMTFTSIIKEIDMNSITFLYSNYPDWMEKSIKILPSLAMMIDLKNGVKSSSSTTGM